MQGMSIDLRAPAHTTPFRCARRALPLFLFLFMIARAVPAMAQAVDSTRAEVREDSAFVMAKSPAGAAIRSAIIPGWGQLYTESYWKIPVIFALGGWLAYGWVTNNRDFITYRDLYEGSITDQNQTGNLNYKLYREFYRDRRDTYAWFFGLLYLLQIADAFVDAHLFDFSVEPGSQTGLLLTPAAVTLSIRF